MELAAPSLHQSIPWDDIEYGWTYTPTGGDLHGIPATGDTQWNLTGVTGHQIRYQPDKANRHISLPVDPEAGGGFLVLDDVKCSLTRGPR